MTVVLTFQGPDYEPERSVKQVREDGYVDDAHTVLTFDGFDLDYDELTVYTDMAQDGTNYTLAVRATYMNEAGVECGMIGWEIQPEALLLDQMPELAEHVGKRYGRVIVTSANDERYNA